MNPGSTLAEQELTGLCTTWATWAPVGVSREDSLPEFLDSSRFLGRPILPPAPNTLVFQVIMSPLY